MDQDNKSQIRTITFGCRLNTVESEAMRRHALAAGHDNLVIVNSCAVTNEAVRQSRQAIRKARRDNPEARIVVTGCAAQTSPESYAEMPEVDAVLGNADKTKAISWTKLQFGETGFERVRVNDIMSVRETASHMVEGLEGRARAFVQIQNGCDHRCTFCIIPYGRGNSRSVPMGDVVRQIEAIVDNGYREVVLTGVDLTSYGADLPGAPKLGTLVKSILRHVPALPRLRLSSIDSVEVDRDLLDVIASEPRLMPHLHLSLQAGDDMILKRMKRRHSREDSIDFCQEVRRLRPDMVFGADLIAGFPTETEAMFDNTLRLVDECDLTFLHVFPYSKRPGTPAAKMPQLDGNLIRDRAARLRLHGEQRFKARLAAQAGKPLSVLMEREGRGRTEHYFEVRLDGGMDGMIEQAVITGYEGQHLTARLAA